MTTGQRLLNRRPILLSETGVPLTPPTGHVELYVDAADKHVYTKDSTGAVIDLATGGGGGSTVTALLNYAASTDIWSNAAITGGTWGTATTQSFTVTDAAADIYIFVRGFIQATTSSSASHGSRIQIDSTTNYNLGGGWSPASGAANPLAGAGPVRLTGLSAAVHTVAVQISASQTVGAYLRASSDAYERLYILVLQVA